MSAPTIAIVGGGFSGLMSAAHLIHQCNNPVRIYIIDNGNFPLGAAYSTQQDAHLLNVRAFNMSAYAEKPNDFVEWLRKQSAYKHLQDDALRIQFIPRKTYGAYLQEIWTKTKVQAFMKNHRIELITDTAVDLQGELNNYTLTLQSGNLIEANCIVLATGHATPTIPAFIPKQVAAHKYFIGNPWNYNSEKNTANDDICILGSGLTMVDTVLSLLESQHKGTIWFHSRKGLLPLSHENYIKSDFLTIQELPSLRLKDLIGVYKFWFSQLEKEGKPGYLAVDKFRPITQEIWKQFTTHEKKYFMRFLRTPWNVARHRIAHEIYLELQTAMQKGKLHYVGGKLQAISANDNTLQLSFTDKQSIRRLEVGMIINCTGPSDSYRYTQNPIIKSILSKGYAQVDDIDLGLIVNEQFVVQSPDTKPSSIFATGVVIKGTLWESFAVPDLRKQIEKMVGAIMEQIQPTQQKSPSPVM